MSNTEMDDILRKTIEELIDKNVSIKEISNKLNVPISTVAKWISDFSNSDTIEIKESFIKNVPGQINNQNRIYKTITTSVIIAVIGLISNTFISYLDNTTKLKIDRRKFETSLIMSFIEPGNKSLTKENLIFIRNAGLIDSFKNQLSNLDSVDTNIPEFKILENVPIYPFVSDGAWGILSDRDEIRRNEELRSLGNDQILEYLKSKSKE